MCNAINDQGYQTHIMSAIGHQSKDVIADALLTQRRIADYLVRQRKAHYHFTVKNNQPGLFQDIALYLNTGRTPILSSATRMTTAASKSAKSGLQPNSTAT